MDIHVFIFSYNESILIGRTIEHYKKYLPSCKIILYDNYSTDNTVEIAKSKGCEVRYFQTNNEINDIVFRDLKNNCWKSVSKGWVIVADMDEYLCVSEEELQQEEHNGISILRVQGYDMIGESKNIELSDVKLQDIKKYVINNYENKNLCFLREKIEDINYTVGAHTCKPTGTIQYSQKIYINKHMNVLGLPYLLEKQKQRFERSEKMRKMGICIHYTNNVETITNLYYDNLQKSKLLS
jgi:hypothetical protein